jgi:hypothetical protein
MKTTLVSLALALSMLTGVAGSAFADEANRNERHSTDSYLWEKIDRNIP